ncbi:MAG: cytochrome c3 family protein, partial [Planctomycetota bacterium]
THLIPLVAENEDVALGGEIYPDDDPLLPFSQRCTCGLFHSYGLISKGWHFSAADPNIAPGRPGQPWILSDARTGTQVPLSYRSWPGTFKPEQLGLSSREFIKLFGRHTPGGGVGEIETEDMDEIMREYVSGKLEINCLSCHNAEFAHNQGEYFLQIARGNFRWASAATCEFASVSGSANDMPDTYDPFMPEPPEDAKKVPPTIKYRETAFDHENKVFFNIVREVPNNRNIVREVPNNRCYFCHSNLYIDAEDTEKWSTDEDIHLTAGLKCVDCHRNGIDHNIIRGYEGEASASTNHLSSASSCEGCHLGEKDSSSPMAGRLSAPVPEHRGIPSVHFERMTCTACHSGPWPQEKTVLTKTARAHRLGTIGVNKSHEALPHINSPVFAEREDGKIAPHKMVWPAFWGIIKDQDVTPIDFEVVKKTVGRVLANEKLPLTGDWPALSDENVIEALKSLKGTVAGEPVYVSGGKIYSLDDSGKLWKEEHKSAEPYLWPIGHNVRPAAQSLGIRYCTDCHATDAPFFFGDVVVDSPIVSARETKQMVEFQDVDPTYARAFAFSFVFRSMMKIIALGSSAIIALVLLLYALKALACIVKVLAGPD